MRRAFTLLELLAVVGVIAVMAGAATMSIRGGQQAARIRGATRDVYAAIRQARSTALVTQQPCVISFRTETVNEEPCAKIEIASKNLFGKNSVAEATTLDGQRVILDDNTNEGSGGETIEEILFAPISEEVLRGIVIKVTKGDETLPGVGEENRFRSKISVFSTTDFITGEYEKARQQRLDAEAKEQAETEAKEKVDTAEPTQAPVSVLWEVNGRCDEAHRVWVYPSGKSPENGLSIKVDRFGAIKVLAPDEED